MDDFCFLAAAGFLGEFVADAASADDVEGVGEAEAVDDFSYEGFRLARCDGEYFSFLLKIIERSPMPS